MKILVPIKCVIDYHTPQFLEPLSIDKNTPTAMNPFDEVALEQAVRLKETAQAKAVIAISIGNLACEKMLRTALAIGADFAILITHEGDIDALGVAKILKLIAEQELTDLVLMGKQAIDQDYGATGQLLSAKLGWSQATFVSQLVVNGDSITVTREIEGGQEMLKVSLPTVVTADLRLSEPRIASLQDIIKAKKKPVQILSSKDFNLNLTPRLTQIDLRPMLKERKGLILDSADALIEKLREDNLL